MLPDAPSVDSTSTHRWVLNQLNANHKESKPNAHIGLICSALQLLLNGQYGSIREKITPKPIILEVNLHDLQT